MIRHAVAHGALSTQVHRAIVLDGVRFGPPRLLKKMLKVLIDVGGHRVIILTSADAFPVVGGRCTDRARRCKARQGRRGKTALMCEYLLPQ